METKQKKFIKYVIPSYEYRCYDFKNIFSDKFGKNCVYFAQTTAIFCKIFIIMSWVLAPELEAPLKRKFQSLGF
jgi:hypothetical protein